MEQLYFLIATLIQKTEQSPGIQVMHLESCIDRDKVWADHLEFGKQIDVVLLYPFTLI